MGQYNNKAMYNSYEKNNAERDELDYYATPPCEVSNILKVLNYDFSNQTVLEPCVGGGHMAQAIEDYISNQENVVLCGTDLEDRGFDSGSWNLTYGEDFLTNDYIYDKVDVIIMNPPYAIYEDFVKKALERATDKLIVLGRTQALEGISRYNNIYINNPPTAVYQYIDRIQCWKGGVKPAGTGAQAYAWFVWDKKKKVAHPELHWIKRDNSY